MNPNEIEQRLMDYALSVDVKQPPEVWEDAQQGFRYMAHHATWKGFRVVPLLHGKNHPGDDWVNRASDDPAQIEAWARIAPDKWGMGLIPALLPNGLQRVVLDADRADAFTFLCKMLGAPTVITAGRYAGEHKGGAHWYITLVDPIEGLDAVSGKKYGIDVFGGDGKQNRQVVGAGSWVWKKPDGTHLDAYYHNVDVAVPRETQEIARYLNARINTPITEGHPLWEWLNDIASEQRAKLILASHADSDEPRRESPCLNEWMRETDWYSLLVADGWTPTGKSRCGCDMWKHPWGTNSDRSSIAHEEGCPTSKSTRPGGSMRVFSTTVSDKCEGMQSLSKFAYVTYLRYDGDYKIAREVEGIPDEDDWGLSGCSWDPNEEN